MKETSYHSSICGITDYYDNVPVGLELSS